jgi:hypothetical protein
MVRVAIVRRPPLGHRILGIHRDVQHDLVDLPPVCMNGNDTGLMVQVPHQGDVLADQTLDHRGDRDKCLVQVEDLEGQHLPPAEGEQLFGQGCRPLAGGQDLRQRQMQRVFKPHLFQQEGGTAVDDGQQIVEIVSNPAGQTADAFHLVGLAQLVFELFVFGDIDEESDRTGRLAPMALQ